MTLEEKKVMSHLVAAWDEFVAMDEQSADDRVDFKNVIHTAQRIVMSRETRRNNPNIFKQY